MMILSKKLQIGSSHYAGLLSSILLFLRMKADCCYTMFKKSKSLPKILGARRGTWSKFHTENQQIL